MTLSFPMAPAAPICAGNVRERVRRRLESASQAVMVKTLGEACGFIVVGMALGAWFDRVGVGMLIGLVCGVPLDRALAWMQSRMRPNR